MLLGVAVVHDGKSSFGLLNAYEMARCHETARAFPLYGSVVRDNMDAAVRALQNHQWSAARIVVAVADYPAAQI